MKMIIIIKKIIKKKLIIKIKRKCFYFILLNFIYLYWFIN